LDNIRDAIRLHIEDRLNRITRDSYTRVTLCAVSARRSSVGLIIPSLVNQASRGLQSPLLPEPGASAQGDDCVNVMWFDLEAGEEILQPESASR
jgi:hypothetical protein